MGETELQASWQRLLAGWRVPLDEANGIYAEIVQAYSAPGRHYHTLDHVKEMLTTVKELASHARNLSAVRLATWLHDVIHDSKGSDNEERSAEYAHQLCEKVSIPEGRHIATLIRKTKTHTAEDDPDAKVLIDADLAILGADESVYRDYAGKIRQEYAWVPEPQYRDGRRRVLESFLSRPRIYYYLRHLEEPARRNMTAEIARLETSACRNRTRVY
jgi:predicted metal-dependent HD superfamily phosphohydrolase